jgi:hypothetical protein
MAAGKLLDRHRLLGGEAITEHGSQFFARIRGESLPIELLARADGLRVSSPTVREGTSGV